MEPYQTSWVGKITAPRCQESGAILRSGNFQFRYVVNTYCLHCEQCKVWAESLPAVEREMVEGIRVGKGDSDSEMSEVDLQWGSIDRVFDREFGPVKGGGNIEKKKKCVMEKKVEEMAKRMVEWEAEEDSGWESVDSIE